MYTGDLEDFEPDKCLGRPRPLPGGRNVGGTFGADIGMDFRPQVGGSRCQGSPTSGTPTQVTYEAGKTYTLAWAPKNHVAASCTNAFIPDNFLRVYMAPYNGETDPTQEEFKANQVRASFSDDPHVRGTIDFKGFQNCPKFCENTDKALCTGTITIPASATPGVYTFQWYWAFNSPNDLYATCWEAAVAPATNDGGNTGGGDNGGVQPTNAPDPVTTRSSTPVEPCFNCCKPKEEPAQGTGQMIGIPAFERGTVKYIDCPSGYTGQLKYMCLGDITMSDEARLVDGECARTVACEEEAKNGAAIGCAIIFALISFGLVIFILYDKEYISWPAEEEPTKPTSFSFHASVAQSNKPVAQTQRSPDVTIKSPTFVEKPEWHYVDENDATVGPVTSAEFKKWANSIGWEVASETYVWNGREVSEWTKLTEVPALCDE